MATLTDSTVIASISLPACSNRLDVTCKTMTVRKVFYPLPHEGDRESYESSIFDQEHIAKLEVLDDPPKPPRADLRDVFNRVITDEDGLRKGDIIIQLPAKYADDNWQEELERLKKAPALIPLTPVCIRNDLPAISQYPRPTDPRAHTFGL